MQNAVKTDAPRTLVFRPLVKGNEALGTRLNANVSVGYFLYATLTIRVICMLRNSRVRFVKTNPQASKELIITK